MSDGIRGHSARLRQEEEDVIKVAQAIERAGEQYKDYIPPIRFIKSIEDERRKKTAWRTAAIVLGVLMALQYLIILITLSIVNKAL